MANYVDGFIIAIKRKNLKAYKKMATIGRNTWMKYGALDYYECYMEDFGKNGIGMGMGFKKMIKLKADETAIFAFITYKSKAHRNQVNKKVHKEFMETFDHTMKMPFDQKRFAMAGCKVLVKN